MFLRRAMVGPFAKQTFASAKLAGETKKMVTQNIEHYLLDYILCLDYVKHRCLCIVNSGKTEIYLTHNAISKNDK